MINLELKENLKNKTRRLGTKADSYLNEFFDIYYQYPELKGQHISKLYEESERMQKASDATRRQFEEILFVFRILNSDKEIQLNKIRDKETYTQLLNANIKVTLKNIDEFKTEYKNNKKLVNDLIYAYGLLIFDEHKVNTSNFRDVSLEKRTVEMKSQYIEIDLEFKELVRKEFKSMLDECGFSIGEEIDLKDYIENNIEKNDYSIEKINDFKERMASQVKNALDLIGDILDSSKKMVVPFYQREYVWTPSLMENFIREIASNNNEMLNIGNILISIQDTKARHILEQAIVDGQQRLTSLILIFNYISKKVSSINHTKYSIDSEILSKVEKSKNSNMISNIENKSNPKYIFDLREVLDLGINEEFNYKNNDSCVKVNYGIVKSFIDELSNDSLVNLLNKLSYVFSTVTFDSVSDEIELFISTNSSRKPLSNYDLIRSFLISKISDDEESFLLKTINNKMSEITELLKFNGDWSEKAEDTFFKFYLNYNDIINYDDTSKSKDLFKRFRDSFNHKVNSSKDLIILLEQTISTLKSYRVIKGVDEIENIYIKDFILSLGDGLKVTSIYDIFMIYVVEKTKVIENENEKVRLLNEFRKILLIIEQFEIKWKLFSFSGDSLSNSLSNLFSKFYENMDDKIDQNNYENLAEGFEEIINENGGFVDKVINSNSNNEVEDFVKSENIKKQKNALKILNRVAFNLFNNGVEYKKNSNNYYGHSKPTIEHIFPRTSTKWQSDDKTNADSLKEHLEEIGNKFIFNKDENSSAGNKTFGSKLKHYKSYNDLKLDKTLFFERGETKFDLLTKEKWTSNDIHIRTQYIIEELLKIWE